MIKKVDDSNELIWAELCSSLYETTIKEMLEERRKGFLNNEFLYYVKNKAIAFLSLSIRNDYIEGADTKMVAYIEGIYVIPEFRRRGVARELIEFVKKWALEREIVELASDCEIDNVDSFYFHKKMGFIDVSRNIHFIKKL